MENIVQQPKKKNEKKQTPFTLQPTHTTHVTPRSRI